MISVSTFVRRVPSEILHAYFDHASIALSPAVDWSASVAGLKRRLVRHLDELDEVSRSRFLNDAERISAMSDDPGQTALFGVVNDRKTFERLPNGHART